MPRYKLLLEYDGTPFRGWQRQATGPSVQSVLEDALLAATGETLTVVAAGRTDAGVHALGQVAHVDLGRYWPPERLMGALNHHLRPHPVVVLQAARVADDFHARFSATRRRYVYRILNRRTPPALERDRVWHVPVPLLCERMHEAAQCLVGRHDFTSFRSSECQSASPVKTLSLIHAQRVDELIEIRFTARSFLHHQVRNIVGTLKLVGEGKASIDHVRAVLAARDRAAAGPTAPPQGLFLESVAYEG
ncbi:tRNA pseudouridine(38-40) synthase TruA [Benzoatithermus flavus]|uniref:tRNA pseudouridine synthase A n=1 Tax=Benzoatithermus flavus TaxID=3108223 RepID=A0ABU8XMU0_9PROT